MSMLDSYWQYRRQRLRMKRPGYAFLDLLLFARAGKEEGQEQKLSFYEQIKGMYKLGQYHSDKTMGYLADKAMAAKDWYDSRKPKEGALHLRDGDWYQMDKDSEEKNGPEPRGEAGDRSDWHKAETKQDDDVRVWVTPDRNGNRIGSNHVGPERQVRVSDEPWPLDRPAARKAPMMIEGPSAERSKAEDNKDGTAKTAGAPAEKSGPETEKAEEGLPANVTPISAAAKHAVGKQAADRGASKAAEIAQARAANKKPKARRKNDDHEL